ncbi:YdcF family protein [Frigoribacterium sp. R86507]|uniref:YdcF family protein n=1 Tax=Frigoribacterium sp. R86507 TaxID=3093850 RepID=UPI0037CB5071
MTAISAGIAAVFLLLFVVSRRQDARRFRNGVFLLMAVGFGAVALSVAVVAAFPPLVFVFVLAAVLVPVLVLALAVFAIANGVTMLRSEGRSLGNLLSLLAGLALIGVPFLAVVLVEAGRRSSLPVAQDVSLGLGFVIVFVAVYAALTFGAFTLWSLVYARPRVREQTDALIVLGSGLIRGEVPPLLRSRLDRALAIYRSTPEGVRRPVLVPSGGQGSDEPRPEGEAMAEYLIAQGADPADVLPETESRSTRENLVLSGRVLADAGRTGSTLVVTNNYHVLRAALLARDTGSSADVVGSPTAAYYVPSAFLREWVAVMVEHKWLNVLLIAPFVVLLASLIVYSRL